MKKQIKFRNEKWNLEEIRKNGMKNYAKKSTFFLVFYLPWPKKCSDICQSTNGIKEINETIKKQMNILQFKHHFLGQNDFQINGIFLPQISFWFSFHISLVR